MASSFDADGYEDLRNYVQNNWQYVAIIDSAGNEVTRIDVVGDSRASWSSGSGTNPLTATITLTGNDTDIDVENNGATTISRTESYKTSSATVAMAADPFTDATLEAANDEVTITHTIEIPPQ